MRALTLIVVPNWRAVLARTWTVRFFALAAFVQGVDVALPWLRNWLPISDEWFGVLTLAFCIAGIIARIVPQKGITPCP